MEYNSFTGNLAVLGGLPDLKEIFLRNNSLQAHLEFLKSKDMSNLISIWLDNNSITMSIPTEIGKLTNLRSVSIANTKLTGTIPTEVGLLTNLQRLWLYKNNLTGTVPTEMELLTSLELLKLEENEIQGTMPSKVCKHVNRSSYELKAVTADCAEIACKCCTQCF